MKHIDQAVKGAVEKVNVQQELATAIGGLTPRPDQIDTAREGIEWLATPSDKGRVLECPTGAGKSCIAQMMIHWLVKNTTLSVAFLVSRTELLVQTKKGMTKAFGADSVNITQGSRHERKSSARVRIMMEQTIASKIRNGTGKAVVDAIESCDVVFIDEVHQTFYSSFIDRVLEKGGRVIGLSATPDDWRLLQWFEQTKIMGLPQIELETANPRILATPVVLSYRAEDEMSRLMERITAESEKAKVRFGLIMRTIVDEIGQAEMRIEDIRGSHGLPALGRNLRWMVKVARRTHAKELAQHLSDHGIPAKAFVSGKGGGTKRQIDAIFEGKSPYRVAVCVHRFSIGYDAPGIQGLILTTESVYPAFVQAVGRVLRAGYPPQKEQAYILDMGGNWKVHGNKYLERRETPSPIIPARQRRERDQPNGESEEGGGRPDAEVLGNMVVLTLPGIAKTDYARMEKPVLLAYCAVEAYQWCLLNPYHSEKIRTLMAQDPNFIRIMTLNRALTSYWFITGENLVPYGVNDEGKKNMGNAMIQGNEDAQRIWANQEPMPDPVAKRLLKARRKFSRQKRAS